MASPLGVLPLGLARVAQWTSSARYPEQVFVELLHVVRTSILVYVKDALGASFDDDTVIDCVITVPAYFDPVQQQG